jgi:2'-5' RNA ligase
VPLPDDSAAEIRSVVEDVRSMPLPAGARDVRWVRLDGLHLTLRFLGPTPESRITATTEAIDAVARGVDGPIQMELAGSGTFPSARRPRTLWIGVSAGMEPLAGLAAATEAALVEAGWPADPRPFRPHLTLARSDGIAAGPLVAERLAAAMADRRIEAALDRIGLFESVTGGGPARYVPVLLRTLGRVSGPSDRVYHQRSPDPS